VNKYVEKFLDIWIDEKPDELIDFHYKDEKEIIIPAGYYHSVASSAGIISPSFSVSVSPSGSPSATVSPSLSRSSSWSLSPSLSASPSQEAPNYIEDKLEEIKRDIRKFLDDTLCLSTTMESYKVNTDNFLRWYLSRLYGRGEIKNGKYGITGSQIYVGLTFPDNISFFREYFLRWNVCMIKGIEDATVDGYAPPTLDEELEELFKWED